MATTRDTLYRWAQAAPVGARFMIVAMDTHSGVCAAAYASDEAAARAKLESLSVKRATRVMEVYDLAGDVLDQVRDERHVFAFER